MLTSSTNGAENVTVIVGKEEQQQQQQQWTIPMDLLCVHSGYFDLPSKAVLRRQILRESN